MHFYFNSHPHEEDDGVENYLCKFGENFNSHPHEEDDAGERVVKHNENIFQLTSSRRG